MCVIFKTFLMHFCCLMDEPFIKQTKFKQENWKKKVSTVNMTAATQGCSPWSGSSNF